MTLPLNLCFGYLTACPLAKAIWRTCSFVLFFNPLKCVFFFVLFLFFPLIHKLGKGVAVISLWSDLGAWMVSGVEGTDWGAEPLRTSGAVGWQGGCPGPGSPNQHLVAHPTPLGPRPFLLATWQPRAAV